MHDLQERYEVKPHIGENAHVNSEKYKALYQQSIDDPEGFWAEQADIIHWHKKWDKVKDVDYTKAQIKWYEGGQLNASYNCIDRHVLAGKGEKIALIWEGDDPKNDKSFTYNQLLEEVCKFANTLKSLGVQKGDRVLIYLSMIPELAFACLACARIGAIHSVVFGGFSPEALKKRITDCSPKVAITADTGPRGGREVLLKAQLDAALEETPVEHCLVVQHSGKEVNFQAGRDIWYHEASADMGAECPPEVMDAEDPLFILYTSGSTGTPKGVLHTTGGYMVYTSLTFRTVFDHKDDDIYWCTADIGWITGHSYVLYGPLSNGATSLLFEGAPSYPDYGRFWDVCDKHKVTLFYTAPTAIRSIAKEGDEFIADKDLSSLRILGSVGEPIDPEAWYWFYTHVGKKNCPVVDTWWQTETGGMLITPLPGATPLKPGCASLPFFGVQPALLDQEGNELEGEAEGYLVLKDSWPSQMRTVYGDHNRFFQVYFSQYSGYYFTGDGAKRDADGYYRITGRIDDVLNISGHRLGTAEIEAAVNFHDDVSESAVVGYPHPIKGQGIYIFASPHAGVEPSDQLKQEVIKLIRAEVGAFAKPDVIQWAPSLPRTRSGKIMRRILRKIAEGEAESIGDTSTLADPSVVDELVKNNKLLMQD